MKKKTLTLKRDTIRRLTDPQLITPAGGSNGSAIICCTDNCNTLYCYSIVKNC